MQFKTILFASLASVVLGQITSTTSAAVATQTSTCAAQNILDACVSQTKGQVNGCSGTDWDCLCTAYGVVLTCYNNCPNDPNVFGVQQSRDQYCNAASAYGTKTASKTATVQSALSQTAAAVTAQATNATASSTSPIASHNAAPGLQVGSGMFALALAGLGLLA